jgi:hypothetical protein
MEEAQFGSSPDMPKGMLVSASKQAGNASAYVRQQEEQLKQPDQ